MTLTQRNVPDDKMGRAMGLLTAAMGLATPVGIAIGGVLAEAMGVAPFFIVDGLACLALGLALYLPKSRARAGRGVASGETPYLLFRESEGEMPVRPRNGRPDFPPSAIAALNWHFSATQTRNGRGPSSASTITGSK